MRLDNYYRLVKNENVEDFNDIETPLNNIDLEELNEFNLVELLHFWENYDGSYENETIFKFENGKVLIDKQNLMESNNEEFANGKTLGQLKKMTKEELIETIREIDTMWNYECGCNKQLVETQNKNERLKTLLYNYICYVESELGITEIEQAEEMGITAEEYKEITDKT